MKKISVLIQCVLFLVTQIYPITEAVGDFSSITYTVLDPTTIFISGTLAGSFPGATYRYTTATGTANPQTTTNYGTTDLILLLTLNPALGTAATNPFTISGVTLTGTTVGTVTPNNADSLTAAMIGLTQTLPNTKYTIKTPITDSGSGTTVTISWTAVTPDAGYTLTKYTIKWTASTAGSTLQSADISDTTAVSYALTVTRPTTGTISYYVTVGATYTPTGGTASFIKYSDVQKISVIPAVSTTTVASNTTKSSAVSVLGGGHPSLSLSLVSMLVSSYFLAN